MAIVRVENEVELEAVSTAVTVLNTQNDDRFDFTFLLAREIETLLAKCYATAAGVIPISEIYAYIPGPVNAEVLYKKKMFNFEEDPTESEIWNICWDIAFRAVMLASEMLTDVRFELAVFDSNMDNENAFACRSFNAEYVDR